MIKQYLCYLVFPLILCGCASPKLTPVSYNGPVTVISNKTASIKLQSGIITGYSGTTIVAIPISTGPYPALHFTDEDQATFVKSLGNELTRLNILNVTSKPGHKDLKILLFFAHTQYEYQQNNYTLDVVMQIKSNKKSFVKKYKSFSSEGESFFAAVSIDANSGKVKASTKLMNKLIPDIEAFLRKHK